MFHWNDMVMIYDGSEFKAILNGQKKVVPLIGNLYLINKPRRNISKPPVCPSLPPPPSPSEKLFEMKQTCISLIHIFSLSEIVYGRPSNFATYFSTSRMCQLIWPHTQNILHNFQSHIRIQPFVSAHIF